MIGSLVGGYRVVTELGSGPTGSVYYAEHPVIGRRAAIKVLSPALSSATERLDRFLTHLKVVSGIRHPNIVDVLDIGQTPNPKAGSGASPLTFIVMEMLEGESLDDEERGAAVANLWHTVTETDESQCQRAGRSHARIREQRPV